MQTFLDDIYVYDQDGLELLKWEIPYDIEATDSMCQAKDGNVYLLCEDEPYHSVLLRLNPDTGEYTEVATDMLETVPPHRHSLLKGKETDFVIWDYEGLYTYNIGDTSAKKVMELYEAPLAWEDATIVTLEDGRVVFVKAFDYDGKPVPESVRFCYVEIEKGDV